MQRLDTAVGIGNTSENKITKIYQETDGKKDACEEATMNVSGTGKDEKLASKQNEK